MTQQQAPEPMTELKLNDQIRDMVNGAFGNGKPVIVAYVDENGQPSLSFRGSTHVHSDNQIAIWARNPEGGLQKAIQKNPKVTLLFRDPGPENRAMLQFRGSARIENSDETREKVYNSIPEAEQNADKDRKGMPVIIDLERVDGFMPGARVAMRK